MVQEEVYWNCANGPWSTITRPKRIVNQDEIVAYVTNHPGRSESRIMEDVYGFTRSKYANNKKYASCLRRALAAKRISRCLCKPKVGGRKVYIYFVESN